jgi:hypothetical protein
MLQNILPVLDRADGHSRERISLNSFGGVLSNEDVDESRLRP